MQPKAAGELVKSLLAPHHHHTIQLTQRDKNEGGEKPKTQKTPGRRRSRCTKTMVSMHHACSL